MEMRSQNDVDRISKLPDCVLGSVVSLLGIKDAVKTCILSRRWRHLYASLPLRVDLDSANILGSTNQEQIPADGRFNLEEYQKKKVEFLRRADHLMRMFDGGKKVMMSSFKVEFFLHGADSVFLDEWISRCILSGVEKIHLLISFRNHCRSVDRDNWPPKDHCRYSFPYRLLSSDSASPLKHLHLQSCNLSFPGNFNGFRCLSTLVLEWVTLDEDFGANLFSTSPQLEDLTLNRCKSVASVFRVTAGGGGGQSLRLMHLKLSLENVDLLRVEIAAMNLTTFDYYRDIKYIYPFEAPKLEKLRFGFVGKVDTSHALVKLANFPRLEFLFIRTIERMPVSSSSIGVTFKNLRQLTTSISEGPLLSKPSWILSILKAAPLLHKFHLALIVFDPHDDLQDLEKDCEEIMVHDQLKEFVMQGCIGNWYEIPISKLVLKASTNLKRMIMTNNLKYHLRERLTDFQRCGFPLWNKSRKKLALKMLQKYAAATIELTIL